MTPPSQTPFFGEMERLITLVREKAQADARHIENREISEILGELEGYDGEGIYYFGYTLGKIVPSTHYWMYAETKERDRALIIESSEIDSRVIDLFEFQIKPLEILHHYTTVQSYAEDRFHGKIGEVPRDYDDEIENLNWKLSYMLKARIDIPDD